MIYSLHSGIHAELIEVLDSKELYTLLSTQLQSIGRSIWIDVNYIRYQSETGNMDHILWIPSCVNLADPGTNYDSFHTTSLQLMIFCGKVPFGLPKLGVSNAQEIPFDWGCTNTSISKGRKKRCENVKIKLFDWLNTTWNVLCLIAVSFQAIITKYIRFNYGWI